MKTFEEYYSDYKWIKVKRFKYDPEKTWKENYEALDDHHLKETSFLIDEIRKLAATIDNLQGVITIDPEKAN